MLTTVLVHRDKVWFSFEGITSWAWMYVFLRFPQFTCISPTSLMVSPYLVIDISSVDFDVAQMKAINHSESTLKGRPGRAGEGQKERGIIVF